MRLHWLLMLFAALLFPFRASAATNEPFRGAGICQFILHDYQLSKQSEASVNFVVGDLLKKLRTTFEFTESANLHIRIRIFGQFETFRDYASTHLGPQEGEYAGVVISNLAGYYTLHGREVVTWAQRDRSFFGNSLLHECCHAIMHEQFRKIPLWLDEGCAVNFAFPKYMRDQTDQKMIISYWLLLKKYVNQKSLPDLREFLDMDDKTFRQIPAEKSYPASWSLFQWLNSTPQRRKILNEMLQRVQKQDSRRPKCAAVLDELYPGGVERLEKDWRDWIIRGSGLVRNYRLIEPQQ